MSLFSIEQLPLIKLHGTPMQMGQQFGEQSRDEIQRLLQIRLNSALQHAAARGRSYDEVTALALAHQCAQAVNDFDPTIQQELEGIANGANISLAQLFIVQGLTDFRDYLSWGYLPDGYGCTSFILPRERTANKSLTLAQSWDLLTPNMPFVCLVKRQPNQGPSTLSLTVTGGLSMIGMNSEGVAIGTNNIKTTDSQAGVHYLHLIHKALSCSSAKEAVATIQSAKRCGAHYYLIGDSSGDYYGLECSATTSDLLPATKGFISHCNHPLSAKINKLNAEDMGESTQHRQQRINLLLDQPNLSTDDIKSILSDHNGDHLAICRHDVGEGISTNGCVIMEPENGSLHACRMSAHEGVWNTYTAS